ncbi:hypothetical protein B4U79_17497 [Dinothrombium tinctorium]|uniref:Uncharacterized protein n=1 Tax=Dinothrombium tinctorium TaxID=1965070 RepID=A0A3S3NYL5_9ACAR|nr:hypothetical protein B4U79_16414 [Dinothrombium tinctorium]RWS11898.1 hypothetical protein B4U79_17497 [Dinothrombium tinctorium]
MDQFMECCNDRPICSINSNKTYKKNDLLAIDEATMIKTSSGSYAYIFHGETAYEFTFKSHSNNFIYEDSKTIKSLLDKSSVKHAFAFDNFEKMILAFPTTKEFSMQQFVRGKDGLNSLPGLKNSSDYPWFKVAPGMEIFAVIYLSGFGSNKGSILAHYRKIGSYVPKNTDDVEYEYKIFDIETYRITYKGKNKGRLVSGFGIGNDFYTKNSVGIYFTSDGRACFFSLDVKRVMPIEDQPKMNLRKPCWQASIFLGCPQSFCYQADVNDIVIGKMKKGSENRSMLFLREAYFYLKEVPSLPMNVPKLKEVHYLSSDYRDILKFDSELWVNSDAAVDWGLDENTYEYTFIKESMIVHFDQLHRKSALRSGAVSKLFEDWNSGLAIDTIAYDHKAQLFYVFSEDIYSTYKVTDYNEKHYRMRFKAIEKEKKISENFPGMPPSLQGSFSLDGKMYFLKSSYYYTKDEGESPDSVEYSPKSVYNGIFSLADCPEPKLADRYEQFMPSKNVVPELRSRAMKGRNLLIITIIATVAFVVITLLFGAFCFLDTKSRVRKRNVESKSKKCAKRRKAKNL